VVRGNQEGDFSMKVFIVGGAGIVGSATALFLASRQIADEIVLYDLNEAMAKSHSMDLTQAMFDCSKTYISAGTWEDAVGSDVVVIAAGLPAAEATRDPCKDICSMMPLVLAIAEGVNRYCPGAVVLSLTNPLDAFNYILCHACALPKERFIAMSVNDSLRFRFALGDYLQTDPATIGAFVIGEHNPAKIPLFSSVTVDGNPVSFTEIQAAEVRSNMNAWWKEFLDVSGSRTAAWTSGVSAAMTIEVLWGIKPGPICCSTILDDGLSIGYPVYLDKTGVAGFADLTLSQQESADFEAAKKAAKEGISKVIAYLNTNSQPDNISF